MAEVSSYTASVAGRYATALFDLATEEGALDTVERDLDQLSDAIRSSTDLERLIRSPIYGREDQARGLNAVAERMGLSPIARNLLGLMASKRRLFVLPDMIRIFGQMLADHRGEITAEVRAARPLSDAQTERLAETLRAASDRTVKLEVTVDPALIGGLVVKLGSRMIDTSIRSKLMGLQTAMKEVG
ncbi:MAG: F0F1 ATP synthase subunit delta [Paracoccaceae bacterium]